MKVNHPYRAIGHIVLASVCVFVGYLLAKNIYRSQEQSATQKAIAACDRGHGLDPVEPPSETKTRLGFDKTYYKGSDSHVEIRLAWIVDMKGKWILVAGPPPEPDNPGPHYVDWCVIAIDVFTGKVLTESIE